jgi:3-hydroxyacyl-[acyl-carrier-protein] dehydratase
MESMMSTLTKSAFICFNRKSLETLLPHRGAALGKIDGVFYNYSIPNMMLGLKEIQVNDPELDGHFPQTPTYPGYAQDEFVCLVAATLIPISIEGFKTDPHVVQKIVRYKKNAVPGDRLIAEVRLNGRRGRFFMFTAGIINQNNEVVAEYEKIIGAV